MRRVRRPGDPAPSPARAAPERVRRAPRTILPENQVAVEVLIKADIIRGTVSESDFAMWVQEALVHYHRWRNGWVGIGAVGGIELPQVIADDD